MRRRGAAERRIRRGWRREHAGRIRTVVAEGAVEAYVLTHSALVDQLRDDPLLSGKLFKMFATTLSDRIAEASAKMRAEVVAKRGGSPKRGTVVGVDRPAQLSAAKMRAHFGLTDATERLLLSLQCSMRKEENALTDSNVQVGDLHLFDAHLCFDWKVFGFHKQQVLPLRHVRRDDHQGWAVAGLHDLHDGGGKGEGRSL